MKRIILAACLLILAVACSAQTIDQKLIEAVRNGEVARVKDLLAKGANPNADEANGWRPLIMLGGTSEQALAIAKLLVAKGADVNYRQPDQGWTPLIRAAESMNVPLAEYLLLKGAKVDLATQEGVTPLHAAARAGDESLVKLFLEHKADPRARTITPPAERSTPGFDNTVDLGLTNSGVTPLLAMALAQWNGAVADLLVKAGAKVEDVDDNGWTLLHRATLVGNAAAIDEIIKLGISPNALSKNGSTPLHISARSGWGSPSKSLAELLLAAGADPAIKNADGLTAAELARSDFHRRVEKMAASPAGAMKDPFIVSYLEGVNEFVALLDPSAPKVAPPTPRVVGGWTVYPDIFTGEPGWDDEPPLTMKRRVKADAEGTILSLQLVGSLPAGRKYTIAKVELNNYDPLATFPMPLSDKELLIRFPKEAYEDGGAVAIQVEYVGKDSSGSLGWSDPMWHPNLTFTQEEMETERKVSVSEDTRGRVMEVRFDSVKLDGKEVPGMKGRTLTITSDKPIQIPGLKVLKKNGSFPHVQITYSFRLKPNTRWKIDTINLSP